MNPILLDLPMPIYTPRLLIRPLQIGDGVEINRAVVESLEELKEWMPWAQKSPSVGETEESVRHSCAQWILREDLRLSIFDRSTGEYMGGTGLHRMKWDIPSFEIGYWVRTSRAGKGYVTEAANALTRYAFTQLHAKRVEVRCDPKNEKSVAVIKRLGFDFEGHLRCDTPSVGGGAPRDTLVYSRLNGDGLPALEVSWAI